jgi:urocanate hydratase
MLACSTGADLVAIHANTNKSQSAGQTAIADGSDLAAERLRAVLDGDTGIGIARMADAGYEVAQEACERFGVGLAGSTGRSGMDRSGTDRSGCEDSAA